MLKYSHLAFKFPVEEATFHDPPVPLLTVFFYISRSPQKTRPQVITKSHLSLKTHGKKAPNPSCPKGTHIERPFQEPPFHILQIPQQRNPPSRLPPHRDIRSISRATFHLSLKLPRIRAPFRFSYGSL
jgi:hypothetical protein